MIALLVVQSSYTDKNSQCYFVRRHLNNTWHNNAHYLMGTPCLTIAASNKPFRIECFSCRVLGWTRGLVKCCFLVIFSKIFKHQMQGICDQVHWLKKPMLAYGKHLPRNNQFCFLPRKNKILPRKKSAQIFEKFTPKNQFSHLVQS